MCNMKTFFKAIFAMSVLVNVLCLKCTYTERKHRFNKIVKVID